MTTHLVPLSLARGLLTESARILERRWVRMLLFLGVFFAVWLGFSSTAHAAVW